MLSVLRPRPRPRPRPKEFRCDDRTRLVRAVSAGVLLALVARGAGAGTLLAAPLFLLVAAPAFLPPLPRLPSAAARARAVLLAGAAWEALSPVRCILRRVYAPLDRLEAAYLRLTNISFMVNQLLFFSLCDRLFLDDSRVAGLYSLMFYNVLAYCVAYVKELIYKEDWSPYVRITERSNVKHLAMSATKIVLEWTKAVTFIMTLVFMLLVFGLEQGLRHYRPTLVYTLVSFAFYMCTEKVFAESFPAALQWLSPPSLEGLELLWAPVLLRAAAAAASSAAAVAALLHRPAAWHAPVAVLYFNVWLRTREAAVGCARALRKERAAVARFRFASADELRAHEEDVCAVCLSVLRRARVTPCQHLFHSDCLRQCLKRSDECPLCKQPLVFC